MDFLRRLAQQLREVWAGMSTAPPGLSVVVAPAARRPRRRCALLPLPARLGRALLQPDPGRGPGHPRQLAVAGRAGAASAMTARTVEVPAERVGTLRIDLAGQGLPAQAKGYELFDEPSLGTTPFQQNVNLLRAKQAVIAKTIRQLEPVANATVEIAKPEPSPFLREKQPTTAAVMVQLKPNATLSRSQVAGIVAFVAKSVEGLTPENVTVVDSKGQPAVGAGRARSRGRVVAARLPPGRRELPRREGAGHPDPGPGGRPGRGQGDGRHQLPEPQGGQRHDPARAEGDQERADHDQQDQYSSGGGARGAVGATAATWPAAAQANIAARRQRARPRPTRRKRASRPRLLAHPLGAGRPAWAASTG